MDSRSGSTTRLQEPIESNYDIILCLIYLFYCHRFAVPQWGGRFRASGRRIHMTSRLFRALVGVGISLGAACGGVVSGVSDEDGGSPGDIGSEPTSTPPKQAEAGADTRE